MGFLCFGGYSLNEPGLTVGIGHAVVWVGGSQVAFESLVGARSLRMRDEVVAKEQTLPMLSECRAAGDHVEVVRADATAVTPDEKGIPRRDVITETRAPEVVVALSLKNRGNLGAGSAKAGHLNKHVHDGLGGEARHSSAAKVFDATDETLGNAGAEMCCLALEQNRPPPIIRCDAYILADGSLHALLEGSHFSKDALFNVAAQ